MKWRLAVVTVFSLLACSDSSTGPNYVPSNPTSKTILDGRHGGNPHFFWLNPQSNLDPFDKSFTGTLNQNMSPVVRICRWTGTSCNGPDVAVLSRSDPTALMDQQFWYEGVWQAW